MLQGDEEEHAVLLTNYFLGINKKAWLLIGVFHTSNLTVMSFCCWLQLRYNSSSPYLLPIAIMPDSIDDECRSAVTTSRDFCLWQHLTDVPAIIG